ncbi:MAG: tRNA pseudouridine(55) synthase, partial [Lentisphaerae bacterium]|nr:tRNA pseudouridine(55) synthase [Lentisphaerota bacterium]
DIGKQLGCGGHLASLRRTASGRLSLENAITFDALENLPRAELSQHVIPILSADI